MELRGAGAVTHTLVCGASRFSMSSGQFRESVFGNRFRESRSVTTGHGLSNAPAVSMIVPNREMNQL